MHARYFVDDRSGCVAVRDRQKTDPEYPGLWPDTEGVVRFLSKKQVEDKCPTCGRRTSHWDDGDAEIADANALAAQLNQADPEGADQLNGEVTAPRKS